MTVKKGEFRCDDCAKIIENDFKGKTTRKRGLTEYEAMKLSWYKDEKEWHRNIATRELVTDKHGNRTSTYRTKGGRIMEMPQQPRKYWKPPKGGEV